MLYWALTLHQNIFGDFFLQWAHQLHQNILRNLICYPKNSMVSLLLMGVFVSINLTKLGKFRRTERGCGALRGEIPGAFQTVGRATYPTAVSFPASAEKTLEY